MSHLPERTEKNCLNCNNIVDGRYCSNCGQENVVPQESAWHLVTHFFNDITHFDGKFFTSLKDLFFKPGFLTKEYVAGKRASYLNPVRMYIFTSFVFFFIFFGFIKSETGEIKDGDKNTPTQVNLLDSIQTNSKRHDKSDTTYKGTDFSFASSNYRDRKEYDSLKKAGKVHEGFFRRMITLKELSWQERYGNDTQKINDAIFDNLKHSVPQILFLSLPLLALILKLLYVRRKNFYYVSHAIFLVHIVCFIFLLSLLNFGVGALSRLLNWDWLFYVQVALFFLNFFYAYKAMRNFYCQRRAKTVLKFILLLISMFIITGIAMMIMLVYSIYKA